MIRRVRLDEALPDEELPGAARQAGGRQAGGPPASAANLSSMGCGVLSSTIGLPGSL